MPAMPGDNLNIEMAIALLQKVSFSAMPSCTLSPLSVVTVGSMPGGFCHSVVGVIWVVKFHAARLWLFVIYILHCILYI